MRGVQLNPRHSVKMRCTSNGQQEKTEKDEGELCKGRRRTKLRPDLRPDTETKSVHTGSHAPPTHSRPMHPSEPATDGHAQVEGEGRAPFGELWLAFYGGASLGGLFWRLGRRDAAARRRRGLGERRSGTENEASDGRRDWRSRAKLVWWCCVVVKVPQVDIEFEAENSNGGHRICTCSFWMTGEKTLPSLNGSSIESSSER